MYPLSGLYHSTLKQLIHDYSFQIGFRTLVKYQLYIDILGAVGQIVPFSALMHIVSGLILHGSNIDGDRRTVYQF